MFDWLGENQSAASIEKAVSEVIKEGKVRTYDMGGSDSTIDMAKSIVDKI